MSERKLVTIRTIAELSPIEGADLIEIARVDDWEVVVKRGEFSVGDPCVYFEIDSFLPDKHAAWQFLVDKQSRVFNGSVGHRLRSIKLRGRLSQGLILSLSQVPVLEALYQKSQPDENGNQCTDDYASLLGIVKYDPPLPAELAGQAEGLFPSFIQKTDEERCQNIRNEIFGYESSEEDFQYNLLSEEQLQKGVDECRMLKVDDKYVILHKAHAKVEDSYEISLKLDGSSMTAYVNLEEGNVKVGVCSRNLELKVNEENKNNTFVKMLNESGLGDALRKFFEETGLPIAIQGELMGPGIQGNREQLVEHEFYCFNIYDIQHRRKLKPGDRMEVFEKLIEYGAKIKHVPIIDSNFNLRENGVETVADLLKMAEVPSINHKFAEGLVFKRLDGNFSFKAISNLFLLREKD